MSPDHAFRIALEQEFRVECDMAGGGGGIKEKFHMIMHTDCNSHVAQFSSSPKQARRRLKHMLRDPAPRRVCWTREFTQSTQERVMDT